MLAAPQFRTGVPWLDWALHEDVDEPWTRPGTISDALRSVAEAFPEIALPEPPAEKPLLVALLAYASARGLPVPDTIELSEHIRSLELDSRQEAAVARLVLAYIAANALQADAVADLSTGELRLVSMDPDRTEQWLAEDANRTVADLEAEIIQLVGKIDMMKTLAAADLVARAADGVRLGLAEAGPSGAPLVRSSWTAVHDLVALLGSAPRRVSDPSIPLAQALGLLATALGLPEPETPPPLPDSVDRALADIVLAEAAGINSGNPAWHAHWVLDAVQDATPILQSWSATFPHERPAATASGPTAAGCPERQDPRAPAELEGHTFGPVLAIPMPGGPPACSSNPWLLYVGSPLDDVHVDAALIRIELGGDDEYRGEVAGPAEIHLGYGDQGPRSFGSINVDLDGNDKYSTPERDETQGFARTGFSLLFDAAGNDEYAAGQHSQGAGCCSLQSGAASASATGAIGLLLDLEGDDRYSAGKLSQGFAEGGFAVSADSARESPATVGGFLVDVAGDDKYTFFTQGLALGCYRVPNATEASGIQTAAALWDGGGKDVYQTLSRQSPDSRGGFRAQGITGCAGDAGEHQAVVGLFLDSGGRDQYVATSATSDDTWDASPAMNGMEDAGNEAPVPPHHGIFSDETTTAGAQADEEDPLKDVKAVVAQLLSGNPIVSVPRTQVGAVLLPGLAILGPGNSSLTEPRDLVIDLGGDDVYTAPDLGGIRLYEHRAAIIASARQPWFLSLVLDVGLGNDTFRPAQRLDPVSTSSASATAFAVGTLLGGAATGIAIVIDAGGANEFNSRTRADAELTQFGAQAFPIGATSYGVMQGAGMNGGLGILASWGTDDRFLSSVQATATMNGGTSTPYARSYGVSQGAGWYGLGFFLAFGGGKSHVESQVGAVTNQGTGLLSRTSVSQGAARGGVGILYDDGGPGSYKVDAPLAQGAGWTVAGLWNAPVTWLLVGGPQGLTPTSSLGLLSTGAGDVVYEATSLAQGVGVGVESPPDRHPDDALLTNLQNRQTTQVSGAFTTANARGAPAVGILVDAAGQDTYTVLPGGFASQGAGSMGGLGVLLDVEGDDSYLAPAGRMSQGAAHLGQGLLIDLAGHDRYQAGTRSQGFATDNPFASGNPEALARVATCVGQPGGTGNAGLDTFCTKEQIAVFQNGNSNPNIDYGTTQTNLTLLAQFPTLGVLSDRQGSDAYKGDELVQGIAEAHLSYPVQAGVCVTPRVTVATTVQPMPVLVKPCEQYYPGTWPPGAPAPRPATASDTSTPPSEAFLLGLLIESGGTDRYVVAGQGEVYPEKQAVKEGEEPPDDGNNWAWRQTRYPSNDLNQTKVPSNVFEGGPAEPVDPLGRFLPSQSYPDELRHALGLGVDQEGTAAVARVLLHDVLPQLGLSPVTLQLLDDSGTPRAPDETIRGTVLLVATVSVDLDASAAFDRLDFLLDHEFLGTGILAPEAGAPLRYILEWNTSAVDPAGLPAVSNERHLLQASLILAPGIESVESSPIEVQVGNPPLLIVKWPAARLPPDLLALSPTLDQGLVLNVTVGPDLTVPANETLPPGKRPGAYLEAVLDGPARCVIFPRTYVAAGAYDVAIDGRCGPYAQPDRPACPDGLYVIRVTATNSQNLTVEVTRALHIDGTAPASSIRMPPIAGLGFLAGSQALAVSFSFDDDHGIPGSGTGVADVDLFRIHPGGTPERVGGGTTGRAEVTSGVATGETLRFVTVARDRLGNSESPCLTESGPETPPCSKAKLIAAQQGSLAPDVGPRDVFIDFARPEIRALDASHTYVSPGVTPIGFTAVIEEQGAGLDTVRIRFDDGQPFELEAGPSNSWTFGNWSQHNENRTAAETPFVYTVLARDRAGNEAHRSGTGVLDAMPPRVEAHGTLYRDASVDRPAGRGGALAILRIDVEDAAVDRVEANISALDPSRSTQTCSADTATADLDDWICPVFLPFGIHDGAFAVRVTAIDKAGNTNWTHATVLVSDASLPITDVRIEDIGFDQATLEWRTPSPGTSQVFYGKTTELGRTTSLNTTYGLAHRVRVEGLVPSTTYFFSVASQNQGGGENRSQVLSASTISAIDVTFPNLREGQFMAGLADVHINTTSRTGPGGIRLALSARHEDGTGILQRLETRNDVSGPVHFQVNTTILGDGPVRFLVEADRAGDFNDGVSPLVLVDNAAPILIPADPLPEGTIPSERPVLTLLVTDLPDSSSIRLDSLEISLDGRAVETSVVRWQAGTPQGRLQVRLEEDLGLGRVELEMVLADLAGNRGILRMPVDVVPGDDAGPRLQVRVEPGPTAAKPGGRVMFLVFGGDGLSLSDVRIELPSWAPIPMSRDGNHWAATVSVPLTAPAGPAPITLRATDGWNVPFEKQMGNLVVDAQAPRFASLGAKPITGSKGQLHVSADEPVRLTVRQDGSTIPLEVPMETSHTILLSGMKPGSTVALAITISDSAGNAADANLSLRMPEDAQAPGPIRALASAIDEEGSPTLTWTPAEDDAGFVRYEVHRRAGNGGTAAAFAVASPPFKDLEAPFNVALHYSVGAVDSAGNAGPASVTTIVRPPGAATLSLDVTPSQGSTTTHFQLRITYVHPSGQPPDLLELVVGDRQVPLTAVTPGADCRTGCSYEGEANLPATSPFGLEALAVRSRWHGVETANSFPGPLVVLQQPADAPVVSLSAALTALVLPVVASRRRHR